MTASDGIAGTALLISIISVVAAWLLGRRAIHIAREANRIQREQAETAREHLDYTRIKDANQELKEDMEKSAKDPLMLRKPFGE